MLSFRTAFPRGDVLKQTTDSEMLSISSQELGTAQWMRRLKSSTPRSWLLLRGTLRCGKWTLDSTDYTATKRQLMQSHPLTSLLLRYVLIIDR